MKDSRTWNRREFSVTPNGLFSVLRPTGWFAASRLPGGFRYLVRESERATTLITPEKPAEMPAGAPGFASESVPMQKAPGNDGLQQATILSQSLEMNTPHHALMRLALIALAAAAITSAVLWSLFVVHF